MKRFSLITKIPLQPGALHRAVEIVATEGGNINRIHYDRSVDSQIIFWEITGEDAAFSRIRDFFKKLGYLQTNFAPVVSLKLTVRLPHEPGALNAFLRFTTDSSALITGIAFDDTGSMPDTVVLTVELEENNRAQALVEALQDTFHLEDIQFHGLKDTSFYVKFARKLARFTPDAGQGTLVELITQINRAAQDLMRLGKNPMEVFGNVLWGAETIADTRAEGFYADIQTVSLSEQVRLHCIQPPCGGNVYLFETKNEVIMLDTGYGAYRDDMQRLFSAQKIDLAQKLSFIILSHGDADHCGAAGCYDVPVRIHPVAWETIRTENRAWGSPLEEMLLETVYSKMIAAFSKYRPPDRKNIVPFGTSFEQTRCTLKILASVTVGDLSFEVLESLGGHQAGEVFLFCPTHGYLFTADSLIPINAITEERSRYNRVADLLMTSVNVDSNTAKKEREILLDIAGEFRKKHNSPCTIFGGHGPVCIEENGRLQTASLPLVRYTHAQSFFLSNTD